MIVVATFFACGPVENTMPGPDPIPDAATTIADAAPRPFPSRPSFALTPEDASAPTASSFQMCAYTSGNATKSDAYEKWLGAPVPLGEAFLSNANWGFLEGSSANAKSFFAGWSSWTKSSGHALVLALPMILAGEGYASLASCAAGNYASHWSTLGASLVAAGLESTVLRPGWEFNGDWSDVYAKGHESDFAGCFRSIVDSMRSVAGASFVFTWNPAIGVSGGFAAENAWPGDAYVDVIGLDIYDISYASYPTSGTISASTYDAVWKSYQTESHGLSFWQAYAKTHDKPLAFPEWGLWARGDSHHGGGDDPAFIQHMHDFIAANDVAYACYFDVHAHDGDHELWPGSDPNNPVVTAFPNGKAAYTKLFGP